MRQLHTLVLVLVLCAAACAAGVSAQTDAAGGKAKGKPEKAKIAAGAAEDRVAAEEAEVLVERGHVLEADLLRKPDQPWMSDPAKNSFGSGAPGSPVSSPKDAKDNVYPSILPAHSGEARLSFGPLDRSLSGANLNASFYMGGPRIYEIGTMRGGFAARGVLWGDEAGIWSIPWKVADGIAASVVEGSERWDLDGALSFENRLASALFRFERGGIEATRTDFADEEDFAFFHVFTLRNGSERSRVLTLEVTAQENIRPMWHKPWTLAYGPDEAEARGGRFFSARDPLLDRSLGGGRRIEVAWGAAREPDRAALDRGNPYRARSTQAFSVTLEPGASASFEFVMVLFDSAKYAASPRHAEIGSALEAAEGLAGRAAERLAAKEAAYREAVLGGARFSCPDALLEEAYLAAKYNMQALRMDLRPDYPEPSFMTSPERAYQRSFGIDSLYASLGAAAAGLEGIAGSTLRTLAWGAAALDWRSIAVDLSPYGQPSGPGRAQEGTQFVGTYAEYLKLTGDRAELARAYPGLRAIFEAYRERDRDGDGWPEGMSFPGLSQDVEALAGPGYAMVDAAVRMWWAAKSLAELAGRLGIEEDAARYGRLAEDLRIRFNRDWWSEELGTWYLGRARRGEGGDWAGFFTDFHAWPVNYPQRHGLADRDKGRSSIERVWRSEAIDARGGFVGGAPTVWQSSQLALGCFAYGHGDYGYALLRASAANPLLLMAKQPWTFSTVNPDPAADPQSNANKIIYSWSGGSFLEALLYGLWGIRPDAFARSLRVAPWRPEAWKTMELSGLKVGGAVVSLRLEEGAWRVSLEGEHELTITLEDQVAGRLRTETLRPGQSFVLSVAP